MSNSIQRWTLFDQQHEMGRITFEVDREVLTEELASEALQFWNGGDDALFRANNDPVKALIMFAAECLITEVIQDGGVIDRREENIEIWNEHFWKMEGWSKEYGITLVRGSIEMMIEAAVDTVTDVVDV